MRSLPILPGLLLSFLLIACNSHNANPTDSKKIKPSGSGADTASIAPAVKDSLPMSGDTTTHTNGGRLKDTIRR